MNPLVLDVEATIQGLDKNESDWNGSAFTRSNSLVLVGLYDGNTFQSYVPERFGELKLKNFGDILVGFNIKYDLHWLQRYGIDYSTFIVWDCQLAHFLLSNQKHVSPSLDEVSAHYGLGSKLDVVKREYWSRGINTDSIPTDILTEYLKQDCSGLTWGIFEKQYQEFKQNKDLYKLFKLQCLDLLALQEMEYNGMLYDSEKSLEHSKEAEKEIEEILTQLKGVYPDTPINFASRDDLSCFLYGGIVRKIESKPFLYTYKAGNTIVKYKNTEVEYPLPRLIEPLKNSELKKSGYFSTSEDTLRECRANKKGKEIIEKILRLTELRKMNGTYYKGIPELCEKMGWTDSIIHGNLNQCIAATGRLSSSRPNLQNMAGSYQEVFKTRF